MDEVKGLHTAPSCPREHHSLHPPGWYPLWNSHPCIVWANLKPVMQRTTPALTVRISWVILPLAMGPALGDALDKASRAVAVTGALLAWTTWAVVLVAVLLPRTLSLTVVRIAAPTALVTANWSALVGARGVVDAIAVAWAALTVVIVFAPSAGDWFVNGSSYGDERRLPLRPPAALLLGPLPLAWAAAVAGPIGTPLLLAAHEWLAGAALAIVGFPVAFVAARALHGLSRRWLVFVPAGVVLHDLHAMVDPALFPRSSIRRMGPPAATSTGTEGDSEGEGGGALDLTGGSLGMPIEIELHEHAEVAPRRKDRRVQVEQVAGVRFAPTRPGAVLAEAARRQIPVG